MKARELRKQRFTLNRDIDKLKEEIESAKPNNEGNEASEGFKQKSHTFDRGFKGKGKGKYLKGKRNKGKGKANNWQ